MGTNLALPNYNNNNLSPQAAMAANNGTMTGGQTTQQLPQGQALQQSLANTQAPVTSLQMGGQPSAAAAADVQGSKLVEALQGAKTGQMEETANRLAAQGITGGQAASQLQKANRDYMFGMSQGLGEFNVNRLRQAADVNRDFLQLELQRQLGLGNLELGSRQLDSQIALRLSEMAQMADTQTRNEIMRLMDTYFGGQEV